MNPILLFLYNFNRDAYLDTRLTFVNFKEIAYFSNTYFPFRSPFDQQWDGFTYLYWCNVNNEVSKKIKKAAQRTYRTERDTRAHY